MQYNKFTVLNRDATKLAPSTISSHSRVRQISTQLAIRKNIDGGDKFGTEE
jgi:hypothetical protein